MAALEKRELPGSESKMDWALALGSVEGTLDEYRTVEGTARAGRAEVDWRVRARTAAPVRVRTVGQLGGARIHLQVPSTNARPS